METQVEQFALQTVICKKCRFGIYLFLYTQFAAQTVETISCWLVHYILSVLQLHFELIAIYKKEKVNRSLLVFYKYNLWWELLKGF